MKQKRRHSPRRFCLTVMSVLSIALASNAQISPTSGPYTSEDGMYTVNMEFSNDTLYVVEPNKKSAYSKIAENKFAYTNPNNGKKYELQVADANTLIAFGSTGQTKFWWSGSITKAATPAQFEYYQKVAEEYKEKMTSDPNDAQLWSLCAAAAINRATLNKEGFETYARTAILSIRQLVEDQRRCPCPKAIPPTLWSKIK
jgi:hypothetical protein